MALRPASSKGRDRGNKEKASPRPVAKLTRLLRRPLRVPHWKSGRKSCSDASAGFRGRRADAKDTSCGKCGAGCGDRDRKSTRLNSSHSQISYAVFCLKKKKTATMNSCIMCLYLAINF